jgi:N-acyl-D-aspartate/D-glutamate deacylase
MTRTAIAGGLVVDGGGGEPFPADVLIERDRIVQVGPDLTRQADKVIDAEGRVVAPGFIDIHSHYDAQIFWDPTLSASCHHGVTSVINGNCGFSLAPFAPKDRPLVLKMLHDLEDMYVDVLEAAVPATGHSFQSYLGEVEQRRPMLNFGSFIGHSTVRIAVMGPAAYERAATGEEIAAMAALVDGAMAAGAMGIATKTSASIRPAPSQFGATDETLALLRAFGAHGRGVAMFSPGIQPGGAFDVERVYAHQAEIGRPFTWIALLAMPDGSHRERMDLHRRWFERGADVHPQVSCLPLTTQCRMSMPSVVRAPAFSELSGKPDAERLAAYASPEWRDRTRNDVRTVVGLPMAWERVEIVESPSAPDAVGQSLSALAARLGTSPFDVLMDLAVADNLVTRIVLTNANGGPGDVAELLNLEGAVLGLSDAGGHPQQICDAVMPTVLLGEWVRERQALSLEKAVHKLSQEPARLMGLPDRGMVAPGCYADLVVFDPKTVGSGPLRTVYDLPGGNERLLADQPTGVCHILVNGVPTRLDERPQRAESGRLLRPH